MGSAVSVARLPEEVTEFRLWSKQYDFVCDTAPFVAFIAGRGAGKSYTGVVKDLNYALDNPGAKLLIMAPTYKLLRNVTVDTFMRICPKELRISFNRGDMECTVRGGATLLFRSFENYEDSRGYDVAYLRLDEAALLSKKGWDTLKPTVRQPGYPHQRVITTTPRSKESWIYDDWQLGKPVEERDPRYTTHNMRSSENKSLDSDYEDTLNYSGQWFRREVLGLFESMEGLVYPTYTEDMVMQADRHEFDLIVAGMDFGYRDPSVILVLGRRKDKTVHLLDEWYETGQTLDQIVDQAKHMQMQYGIRQFYADPSRPDAIKSLINRNIPALGANNDILAGILRVTSYLPNKPGGQTRLTLDPKCINAQTEFVSYAYMNTGDDTDKEKKNLTEKPVDALNHAMDALRYGIRGLESRRTRNVYF